VQGKNYWNFTPDGFSDLPNKTSNWYDLVHSHRLPDACRRHDAWLSTAAPPLEGQLILPAAAPLARVRLCLSRTDWEPRGRGWKGYCHISKSVGISLGNQLSAETAALLLHFARHVQEETWSLDLWLLHGDEEDEDRGRAMVSGFNPLIAAVLEEARRDQRRPRPVDGQAGWGWACAISDILYG